MTFREKMHWVAFLALFAGFGWYFAAFPWALLDLPTGRGASAARLGPVALVVFIPMVVVTLWSILRNRRETRLREDEREIAIHRFGTHMAYYPLVLGTWANAFVAINGITGARAVLLLVATVVTCELIRVGAQLFAYRREDAA
jgi:hypothetical protein